MAETNTTNYGWVKPENGASSDTWGIRWNENADAMDGDLKSVEDKADASLKAANTLSEFNDDTKRAAARSNLALGSTATLSAGNDTDRVPQLAAAVSNDHLLTMFSNKLASTGILSTNILTKSGNLSGLGDQSVSRANLGLRIGGVATFVSQSGPSGGADGDIWCLVP